MKFTETMEAVDNFYRYPEYPEIEKAQSYNETKVSNYRTGKFFDGFEAGKIIHRAVPVGEGNAEEAR